MSVQNCPQLTLQPPPHFPRTVEGQECSGRGPWVLGNRWILGSLPKPPPELRARAGSGQHVRGPVTGPSHLSRNRLSRALPEGRGGQRQRKDREKPLGSPRGRRGRKGPGTGGLQGTT